MAYLSNSQTYIDSRDIIERIEELENSEIDEPDWARIQELEAIIENASTDEEDDNYISPDELMSYQDELEDLHIDESNWQDWEDDKTELEELRNVADQGEDSADWNYGATLIREDEFENYVQDLASDTCNVNFDEWPCTCIDWDEAADQLRADYFDIDFDGVTYLVRY
jgi:hypothetical protein